MPGLTNEIITTPWTNPICAPNNVMPGMKDLEDNFPQRKEIWDMLTDDIRQQQMYVSYFNPDKAQGDYRLFGLMTETEAYLHMVPSSSWLSDGVSSSISVRPSLKLNMAMQGDPFAQAFWSWTLVLYIQRIKTDYPSTWSKLLSGDDVRYKEVARTFLAYHDRFSFLLRLYVDKNDITTRNRDKINHCRDEKAKALRNMDVIALLRAGHGSQPATPVPAPTPAPPTPAPLPTPAPPATPGCQNTDDACDSYKSQGMCRGRFEQFMKLKCPVSCGYCNQPLCVDTDKHCDSMKREGFCTGQFEPYMKRSCPVTCGTCGGTRLDDIEAPPKPGVDAAGLPTPASAALCAAVLLAITHLICA
jgi:predicted metal-binding protein